MVSISDARAFLISSWSDLLSSTIKSVPLIITME
jgi:hypothetical protein